MRNPHRARSNCRPGAGRDAARQEKPRDDGQLPVRARLARRLHKGVPEPHATPSGTSPSRKIPTMKMFRTLSILFALVAVPSLALADRGGGGAGGKDDDHEARHAKKLAEFDADNDGKLDEAERTKMHEAMADKHFDELDANDDGSISRAEFKAGAKQRGMHKRGKHGKGKGKGHDGARDGKGARNGKAIKAGKLAKARAQARKNLRAKLKAKGKLTAGGTV